MKSLIDIEIGDYSKNIFKKILLITVLELLLLFFFKRDVYSIIYVYLLLNLYKFYLIIYKNNRLTSPIFFTSVGFIFWLSLGNFFNVLLTKYTDENHYYLISALTSLAYLMLLSGMMLWKKVRIPKIIRGYKYLDYQSSVLVLYGIISISLIASIFYNLPIITALFKGQYFGDRITMIYGRGYLNVLGQLHGYAIPFLLMIKFHKNIKIRPFDLLIIIISFFLVIIPLHRGPILTLLLTYLFVYNDFKKPIPIKKLVKYGSISVLLFGAVIPMVRGIDRTFLEVLRNEIGIHTWNLSHYIGLTEKMGYFGLKPLTMALAILLPGHQEGFEIWIKEFSTISVNVGGASMSLIGEGFMEYGVIGVMINFFFLGSILTILFNNRGYSYGHYFFYLYFLNRTESIIQFGFSKVLITLIITFIFFKVINNFKPKTSPI